MNPRTRVRSSHEREHPDRAAGAACIGTPAAAGAGELSPDPARAFVANKTRVAGAVAAAAAFNERLSDRGWTDLVAALQQQSSEFRMIWREYGVLRPWDWRKVINHPELGRLQFDPITLEHPPDHQIRIIFYRPADVGTEANFRT